MLSAWPLKWLSRLPPHSVASDKWQLLAEAPFKAALIAAGAVHACLQTEPISALSCSLLGA